MRWFSPGFAAKPRLPLEVPPRLRAMVRARESSIIVLAAVVGVLGGLVVVVMGTAVGYMHLTAFGLDPGERLSGRISLDLLRAFVTPCLGGLLFGLVTAYISRRRGSEVDPIEANALHGGRMSMRGSLIVAAQTVWSSGVGASVGLEAGYTQWASGIASKIGQAFRLRRADMRILVGAGSAAAIAGAFGAPLGGAFYGFELIIGSYTVNSLAPVGIASLLGYLTAQALSPSELGIDAGSVSGLAVHDVLIAAGFGVLAGLFGILLMRGVAASEQLFSRLKVRPWLRPTIAGAIVGLLAIVSPQVMSSGHGALHLTGLFKLPLETLAIIFALKSLASIVSLGSGFRGGLFFASLLLGALGGQLFAIGVTSIFPTLHLDPDAFALVGLSVAHGGGADRGHHRAPGDPRVLRLHLRHLALPFARRDHSQRGRCRLDPRFDGGADDARRRAHHGGGDAGFSFPRGFSARLDQPGDRPRRRWPLCRHGAGGGGACAGNRGDHFGARHPASRRPHAVAANDRAGSDLGLRSFRSGSAARCGYDRKPPGDRPAQRSACATALLRRVRAAAARTPRRGVTTPGRDHSPRPIPCAFNGTRVKC
jgi:H+/Cl- antiporter ClcA